MSQRQLGRPHAFAAPLGAPARLLIVQTTLRFLLSLREMSNLKFVDAEPLVLTLDAKAPSAAARTQVWLCAKDLAYLFDRRDYEEFPCYLHFPVHVPRAAIEELWRAGFGRTPSGLPILGPDGRLVFVGRAGLAGFAGTLGPAIFNSYHRRTNTQREHPSPVDVEDLPTITTPLRQPSFFSAAAHTKETRTTGTNLPIVKDPDEHFAPLEKAATTGAAHGTKSAGGDRSNSASRFSAPTLRDGAMVATGGVVVQLASLVDIPTFATMIGASGRVVAGFHTATSFLPWALVGRIVELNFIASVATPAVFLMGGTQWLSDQAVSNSLSPRAKGTRFDIEVKPANLENMSALFSWKVHKNTRELLYCDELTAAMKLHCDVAGITSDAVDLEYRDRIQACINGTAFELYFFNKWVREKYAAYASLDTYSLSELAHSLVPDAEHNQDSEPGHYIHVEEKIDAINAVITTIEQAFGATRLGAFAHVQVIPFVKNIVLPSAASAAFYAGYPMLGGGMWMGTSADALAKSTVQKGAAYNLRTVRYSYTMTTIGSCVVGQLRSFYTQHVLTNIPNTKKGHRTGATVTGQFQFPAELPDCFLKLLALSDNEIAISTINGTLADKGFYGTQPHAAMRHKICQDVLNVANDALTEARAALHDTENEDHLLQIMCGELRSMRNACLDKDTYSGVINSTHVQKLWNQVRREFAFDEINDKQLMERLATAIDKWAAAAKNFFLKKETVSFLEKHLLAVNAKINNLMLDDYYETIDEAEKDIIDAIVRNIHYDTYDPMPIRKLFDAMLQKKGVTLTSQQLEFVGPNTELWIIETKRFLNSKKLAIDASLAKPIAPDAIPRAPVKLKFNGCEAIVSVFNSLWGRFVTDLDKPYLVDMYASHSLRLQILCKVLNRKCYGYAKTHTSLDEKLQLEGLYNDIVAMAGKLCILLICVYVVRKDKLRLASLATSRAMLSMTQYFIEHCNIKISKKIDIHENAQERLSRTVAGIVEQVKHLRHDERNNTKVDSKTLISWHATLIRSVGKLDILEKQIRLDQHYFFEELKNVDYYHARLRETVAITVKIENLINTYTHQGLSLLSHADKITLAFQICAIFHLPVWSVPVGILASLALELDFVQSFVSFALTQHMRMQQWERVWRSANDVVVNGLSSGTTAVDVARRNALGTALRNLVTIWRRDHAEYQFERDALDQSADHIVAEDDEIGRRSRDMSEKYHTKILALKLKIISPGLHATTSLLFCIPFRWIRCTPC